MAFRQRPDAEKAIASLQGAVVGSCKLRLMWGKTQQDKILDWNTQQQVIRVVMLLCILTPPLFCPTVTPTHTY